LREKGSKAITAGRKVSKDEQHGQDAETGKERKMPNFTDFVDQ
jgi:hypothetical protein